MNDFYADILLENAGEVLVLPLGTDLTLPAMVYFGGYALGLPLVFATLGVLLGGLLNWGVGFGLAALRRHYRQFLSDAHYARFQRLMRRYGIWLLPFFWLPFGNIAAVLAGFAHLRWWWLPPLLLLGQGLHLAATFPQLFGL